MKQLSEETLSLIHRLYPKKKSWLNCIFSNTPNHARAIEKIAVSNEPAAIVQIASLVFSSDMKTQPKIAEAIARLLKGLPQQDYVILDSGMRNSYLHYPLLLEPKDITDFRHLSNYSWVPLVIASMSSSGYIREKSISLLSETKKPEVLPFLLLRANDWVDQVRSTAIKAITPYLAVNFAPHLIDNLYLISRLEHSRARDDGEIKKHTYSVLLEAESKIALLDALDSQERCVKRTCYELSLRSSHVDTIEILKKGFSDEDVLIRLSCCKQLKELPRDAVSLELVHALVKDHFSPVRQEALGFLAKFDYPTVKQLLHDNLCDRAASVRQTCRSLIKHLKSDLPTGYFKDFYLDYLKLDDPKNADGAIGGLREICDESLSEAVKPFLKHRYAGVRKAAIRALFKVNSEEFVETFYHHLMTDSGIVAKEAALAISRLKSNVSGAKLLTLFNQAEEASRKLIILWLIRYSLSKWEKITTLLRSCSVDDKSVLERCKSYLQMWIQDFNKGGTSTSAENLTSARAALSEVRDRLDSGLCENLDFYLKGN